VASEVAVLEVVVGIMDSGSRSQRRQALSTISC